MSNSYLLEQKLDPRNKDQWDCIYWAIVYELVDIDAKYDLSSPLRTKPVICW